MTDVRALTVLEAAGPRPGRRGVGLSRGLAPRPALAASSARPHAVILCVRIPRAAPLLGRTPALSCQGLLPSGANSKCAECKRYYTNETVSNRSLTSCVKHGIPYFYGSLRTGSHCPGFSVEVDKLFLSRTG